MSEVREEVQQLDLDSESRDVKFPADKGIEDVIGGQVQLKSGDRIDYAYVVWKEPISGDPVWTPDIPNGRMTAAYGNLSLFDNSSYVESQMRKKDPDSLVAWATQKKLGKAVFEKLTPYNESGP